MKKFLITLATTLGLIASSQAVYAKSGEGVSSWYGPGFNGKRAADGSVFDQNAMTTACHPGIKLGSKLKVTNKANGKSVVVKCTDRGAFHKAKYGRRVLDMSKGAFSKIANTRTGVINVKYEVIK